MFWLSTVFFVTLFNYGVSTIKTILSSYENLVEVEESERASPEVEETVLVSEGLRAIRLGVYRVLSLVLLLTNFWYMGVIMWVIDTLSTFFEVKRNLILEEYMEDFVNKYGVEEVRGAYKGFENTWALVLGTFIMNIPFILTVVLRIIYL